MERIEWALTCFKAYDIRGRLGIDLDENTANRIDAAFAVALDANTVVLGRDVRASSEKLASRVAQGLIAQGCDGFCHLHFVGCNGGDYIGHSSDARSDVPRVEGFHAVVSDLKCGTAADGNGETVAYG